MECCRKCLTVVAAAAVALALAQSAGAERPATRAARPARVAQVTRVEALDNQRRIDINSINMFVTNFGSWAYDLSTGNAGLNFPRGTNKTAIFAGGIWFGARVGSEVRTVVGEYSQEYTPGQVRQPPFPPGPGGVDSTWDNPNNPDYIVYKVARFTGNPEDTAHVERNVPPADPTATDPLVHHSWSEYMHGAVPHGAPFKIYRLPSTPGSPDSVDVPGPDLLGADQMLWSVYNDFDPAFHTNQAGNSAPLGLEIRQSIFGFNRTGALGNTVFMKFEIVHPGFTTETLNDMYVSLWADPDLGFAGDDVVGCDTTLSLGYVYNFTNSDQVYGTTPPAVGYDFFKGPTVGGEILPLTSFNKYINGTDPDATEKTYNYMQGLNADGTPVINPTTVPPRVTTFVNSGDPVANTGWLDKNAADKRMMLNSGPFTMAPGDTQVVVGAIVVGQGSDRLASVTALKFYDNSAQAAFDANFNLPPPPPQPKVTVTPMPGAVQLCWDNGSWANYDAPTNYKFEGYVVYQGASSTGPWKRLATYDIVDSIGVVRDTVFDTGVGQTITDFPVAFGGENALAYCYTATSDAITGGPLNNGTPYYFAVTAYAVAVPACLGPLPHDPTCPLDNALENPQTVVTGTPAPRPTGTDPATARALCPDFIRANSSVPGTTDKVQIFIVNPDSVKGDTYEITYAPLPRDTVVNGETVHIGWNLIDVTTGEVLLANQVEKSGNTNYQVVDGLQVKVIGTYSLTNALNYVDYFDAACPVFPSSDPPLQGLPVGAGLESFAGGAGTAFTFGLGGGALDPVAQADSFTTVEVRFSHTERQHAYLFYRKEQADGSAPAGGRGYTYAGFPLQNFTAWDITHNIQLEVGFVERAVTDADGNVTGPQPATHDSLWAPDASSLGGREYFFISKRAYTGAPSPELAQDQAILNDPEWEYAAWLTATGAGRHPNDGDVLRFVWGFLPGTPNDTIRFQTRGLVRGDIALEKAGLNRIRVVPNPYYNRSRYELSQFNRIMRFTNLPEVATIRIYSLSGQLVRTLQKTDPTSSMMDWDLQNENRLPVASGVYVYHVSAPGVGTTFGRLVVFMEKERLNTF